MNKSISALQNAKSDKELFDLSSAIVIVPKIPGTDSNDSSFLLHAPLELCARYFLLPLVDEASIFAARESIQTLAIKYDSLIALMNKDYVKAQLKNRARASQA